MDFKVGIDVDEVILKTVDRWLEYYNSITQHNLIIEELTEYDLTKAVPRDYRYLIERIFHNEIFWSDIELCDGVEEFLTWLKSENIKYYFITATDIFTPYTKWVNLLNKLPPSLANMNDIVVIKDKNILELDAIIDDCFDNLKDNPITCKIMVKKPWNRSINSPKVHKIDHITNAIPIILKAKKEKEKSKCAK